MKACIITIYKNHNVGACLQAFAMQKILTDMNHNVVFCKDTNSKHSLWYLIMRLVGAVIRLRINKLQQIFTQYKQFNNIYKHFNEIPFGQLKKLPVDCFILGSDQIWDLTNDKNKHTCELFWGLPFKGKKIISYAPSAANTTLDDLSRTGFTSGSVEHISSISVRDQNTKELVQTLTARPITIVCDPTLLLPIDKYDIFVENKPKISNYILIYSFKSLSKQTQIELTGYADKTSRKIVSFFNSTITTASIILERNPYNFITYFKYADYIITDSYHGSIFSIIFQKQFVSLNHGKTKIDDLLKRFNLSHRFIQNGARVPDVLEIPIDWKPVDKILNSIREQSFEFLHKSL